MRSDTVSVTIGSAPHEVYNFVSDINHWPQFSDFAPSVTEKNGYWIIHSPQGDVVLKPYFYPDLSILDHLVTLPSGQEVLIPYRVVPNEQGSELIMTNFQAPGDSDQAYAEQLEWMKKELLTIKDILERRS